MITFDLRPSSPNDFNIYQTTTLTHAVGSSKDLSAGYVYSGLPHMKDRVVQTSSIFSPFQMVTSLGSFIRAEILPHFLVELPTHYHPHLLRVLPQQVPVIPCVVTILIEHVLRK